MKYTVIEIRNMHTAIHELFIVHQQPKTTLKYFQELENMGFDESGLHWSFINRNTEYLGEVNFRTALENSRYGKYYAIDGDIYEVLNAGNVFDMYT